MKRRTPKIDATSDAILLNRYVALVRFTKYNESGSIKDNKPLYTKQWYQVQWQNIKNDIKALFTHPLRIAPHIAYSLLAFYFIFQGKHLDAHLTAFPLAMGAVTYDASAQTSHSGEPATITWSHTIGSGANRLITIFVSGLASVNAPTWDGNATTSINTVGNLQCAYYLAPATGSANCACTGGNIKVGASISFSDVDQSTPIGATTTEDGSTSPNDVSLTTTYDGSIRVDVLGANRDDANTPTGTLDSGTLRNNPTTPQNQFRISIYSYTNEVATASSTTRTWTTSGFNRWYSAFEVHGATTASTFVPRIDMI